MEFKYGPSDFIFTTMSSKDSKFDFHFKSLWEKAVPLCRYQLTQLQNITLKGKYGFVAQVNPPRTKRCPVFIRTIDRHFDPDGFNFNKIPVSEVLLKLKFEAAKESHDLVINVHPLEFGSSLLVPFLKQCIPQKVTLEGLTQLIHLMLLSNDRNIRSGFSSPGGFASVNHQHYHVYYLQERLYLENAEVERIFGPCYTLKDYPSKGFAFELHNKDVDQLAKLIAYLQREGVAHNMFLTRGKSFNDDDSNNNLETLRVFVWARKPLFEGSFFFKPALCELAGHLLLGESVNVDSISESDAAAILETLTTPYFRKIRPHIRSLYLH